MLCFYILGLYVLLSFFLSGRHSRAYTTNGQTHYVPWLGAILITIILQLCQVCVYSLLKLSKRGHAITYFPSVLLLTVLTSIRANSTTINFGNWIWVAPVLLYLFIIFGVMNPMSQNYVALDLFLNYCG